MIASRSALAILLSLSVLQQPSYGASLLGNKEPLKLDATEFYMVNPDEAALIRIQLWGDVTQPGYYNIPTGTTLRSMLGYVGGPKGIPDSTKITISREPPTQKNVDEDPSLYKIKVEDLLDTRRWASFELQAGDVVYMDGDKSKQTGNDFFDALKDVMFVLGFVTTTVSTYLVIQQLSR